MSEMAKNAGPGDMPAVPRAVLARLRTANLVE